MFYKAKIKNIFLFLIDISLENQHINKPQSKNKNNILTIVIIAPATIIDAV